MAPQPAHHGKPGTDTPFKVGSCAPTPWLAAKRWYNNVAELATHLGTKGDAVDVGAEPPIDLALLARFVLSRRLDRQIEESQLQHVKYVTLRRRTAALPESDLQSDAQGDEWRLRVIRLPNSQWVVETLCRTTALKPHNSNATPPA